MGCRASKGDVQKQGAQQTNGGEHNAEGGKKSGKTRMEEATTKSKRTHSQEEQLAAAMRYKRRLKNVWAETVAVGEHEVEVTAAMAKDDAMAAFLTRAVRSNFVFAELEEGDVSKVVHYMARERVPRHKALIVAGEKGEYFYVVESGTFDFLIDGKTVAQCSEGGSFGELALLYGAPRAATVAATSDAVVWALDRVTFRATVANSAARTRDRVYKSLARVELLRGLTDDQLAAVADAVQAVTYPAGTRIIAKNETGNVFYMIQQGSVDCTDVGAQNQFGDLVLNEGEYFGERALLTDQLRAANVTAKTDVTLLALDREAFVRILGPLRDVLDRNLSLRVLASVDILSELSADERQKAASLFTEKSFSPGTFVLRQGDPADALYVLKAGRARVQVSGGEGGGDKPALVKVLDAGDYFGEMALLSAAPRTDSVVAEGGCECFVLRRCDFVDALGTLDKIRDRVALESRSSELAQVNADAELTGVKLTDLQTKATLGSGTFGRVKLVQYANERVFALKIMHKSEIVTHAQVHNVIQEKELMALCHHPFVLKLYAAFADPHRLHLLLEFVPGGELFSVLHTDTCDGVPEKQSKFYAACVASALKAIHDKKVAYRDLKPENVLVDEKGYPKIVDFGFAKVVNRKTYTLCGTPEYLAPEIVLGRGHNAAVDWWAFGVLVFESLAGRSPFADDVGMDQVVICKNIVHGRLVFPKKFPSIAADLCRRLLNRTPVDRLGAGNDAVLDHKWFVGLDPTAFLQRKLRAPWVPTINNIFDTSNFDPCQGDDTIDASYKDDPSIWVGFQLA